MTLFLLIGPSGSGKTTLAEALVSAGIDTIRSYTTRPMRPGEQQGREHIFITEQEATRLIATRRLLAYTLFGGYRYFALTEQIAPLLTGNTRLVTYVIDERGYQALQHQLIELRDEMRLAYGIAMPAIDLVPLRIERPEADMQDIDPARRQRDHERDSGLLIPYRAAITNDAPTAATLTRWAEESLAPALTVLSSGLLTTSPVGYMPHLTTAMGTAEIIAHMNDAYVN